MAENQDVSLNYSDLMKEGDGLLIFRVPYI